MNARRLGWLGLLLLAPLAPLAAGAESRVLDDGTAAGGWRALRSDDVSASLAADGTPRVTFDFQHRAGYAGLERALAVDWPEDFELRVDLDGEIRGNDLEVKLVDETGDNVWWYRRRSTTLAGPTTLHLRRRQVEWAWGPRADHALGHTAKLQLIVNAVQGGAGTLGVGRVTLEPRAPAPATAPTPLASDAGRDVPLPDGSALSAWHCAVAPCALVVDAGAPREFDGLRLAWAPGGRPRTYLVEALDEAGRARPLAFIEGDGPAADWLYTPDAETRRLRLSVPWGSATLASFTLLPATARPDRNRLVAAAAAEVPRGTFPRGVTGQAWWTLVGSDNGRHSGLLSEDGALETDVGGPSVEPFVVEDGRVVSWADVTSTQALDGGDLPLPSVTWHAPRWTLETSAFAAAEQGERLWARYRLTNTSDAPLSLTLLLALRPFQVNPPAQFLNTPGGLAPLADLRWEAGALRSAGGTTVAPLEVPDRVALAPFEVQLVPALLADPARYRPPGEQVGLLGSALSSGVLAFDVRLAPHAVREVGLLVAWSATPAATPVALARARARVVERWRARLGRVVIEAPDSAEASALARAMRTATAHLLMSRRDGLLRPGTRAYARSWIRDGAMMSAALLRLGEREAPEDYLRAYLPFLYSNGKVPCCVDARGSDPVPEHDSAGEFLYLAAELWRLGGDRALVARAWPGIEGAVRWLDGLRAETRAAGGADAGRYRGLLPPSISHEGYSAKPMHSYWDDFWALRGYRDAIALATALGHPAEARRWTAARAEFAADVAASLVEVQARQHIDYVPGAADLGDFDATSTTIALSPGTGGADLPAGALAATFERYWDSFERRRSGALAWDVYTPYEWRVVGSFVRLGQRERALGALRWFFADRKPPAWNQWPEVIGREDRVARFIGDLPHGWVASDFLRSALDLVAYEDEADGSLVLGAGLPPEWLAGRGLRVRGLVTRYGRLGYTARATATGLDVTLERGLAPPPGGLVLRLPVAREGTATVDGRAVPYHDGVLRLPRTPARIHFPNA
jgi:hypothetical protein